MEKQIAISYPESLAFSLKMGNQEFENEMKFISLVKLYEMGNILSGVASRLMNISRIDFLQNLAKYNVSYFHKELEDELESDIENA